MQADFDRDTYAALLEAKLQPWRIRATLAFAGVYQITHELIKEAVIDEVRSFYCNGFNEAGMTYDDAGYEAAVLALDPKKRKMRASLLWLVHGGAITAQQADRLDAIYAHRHDLTHELGKYIVDPAFEPDMQLFTDAVEILREILRFWTRMEIDLGSFEQFGDVDPDEVTPGRLLLLQLCIDAYVEGLKQEASADGEAGR
ncbi:hypothetical protein ACPPVO_36470 [Dactylosporangium sp. McL0621]|uniref:hypothetical protein n=1 Tax=Dactylosporangium sp. McL0621 TaxID=3415678 RepID=UPI003CEC768D